jgi:hypothetical protein
MTPQSYNRGSVSIWCEIQKGDRQPEFINVTPSAHGSSGADRRATFQNRPSYGGLTLDCEMKRYRSF